MKNIELGLYTRIEIGLEEMPEKLRELISPF